MMTQCTKILGMGINSINRADDVIKTLQVSEVSLEMEFITVAAVSVIPEKSLYFV